MLDVEQWAELRREYFVRGVAIKELVRRRVLSRNTIRAALRSDAPPLLCCPERPSKLWPFKNEIDRPLRDDPELTGRHGQLPLTERRSSAAVMAASATKEARASKAPNGRVEELGRVRRRHDADER